MSDTNSHTIRTAVRQQYGDIAESQSGRSCCSPSCCSDQATAPGPVSSKLGYSQAELGSVPDGADLGLGCGNPRAIAAIKAGETVLDLGAGTGFDCFLAAQQAGETGRVIGVDMTPQMLIKARSNSASGGYANVEFRLGEIEHLPVADQCIDVIISNCVINLSPDKPRVFREAFRVLKPGGRLAISDVVAFAYLPDDIKQDMTLYTGCMAGASPVAEIETLLKNSGFEQIQISPRDDSKSFMEDWAPGRNITDYVISASIEAVRPG